MSIMQLGYEVAKELLPKLDLSLEQSVTITNFLKGDLSTVEAKIVKDADAIAFFMDKTLRDAFKKWAEAEGLTHELQQKLDKVKKLNFEISKKIARPFYTVLKQEW